MFDPIRHSAMVVCLALSALLSGCVSPEQAAYNRRMQAQQEEAQRAAYRARLTENCDAMGFRRGTDAHANCILSQHQQNQGQMMQLIQMEEQRQLQTMPRCSDLPPGMAGYHRAQGRCK